MNNSESGATLGFYFIDCSETRERLIEAIGEIDLGVDEVYIPRQAMQELLDGFEDIGQTTESIWIKLIKNFLRFLKFLIGIFIVLVLPSTVPANGNLDKQGRNTNYGHQNLVQSCWDYVPLLELGLFD